MVGKPEGFSLDHFSPPNVKGKLLLFTYIALKSTELEHKLVFISNFPGIPMTGHINGLIAALERLLKKPL